MSKSFLLFLFVLFNFYISAQQKKDFGDTNSHEYYVSQLMSSKDQNFQNIINRYQEYIDKNPNDIIAQLELCKFIGNSYWDEYEGYNLKYDETEECIANLAEKYPRNPKVLIYRADNLYGENKIEILDIAKDLIETNRTEWLNTEIAEIYEMLGDYHQENEWLALKHYKKAQKLNDSLDLSLSIAKIYQSQGKNDLAKETLLSSIEKDTLTWKMNQKANLLLELNEPEQALYLFDIIGKKDSTIIDNNEMAKAMVKLGDYNTAREFLVRDTIAEWSRLAKKQALFNHDFLYSDTELALEVYRKLQEEDSDDDFFGVKRLQIFFKNPILRWNFSEVLHLLLLYGLIVIIFLLPYLWILPVYGIGDLLRKSGIKIKYRLEFSWNILHFWFISFFYLLASVLVIFVFEYEDSINYYFDIGNNYLESNIVEQSLLANEMIFYVLFMAVTTVLVLNKKRIRDVFKSNLSVRQMIGLGVLFVVFNRILLGFLSFFIDLDTGVESNIILNVKEEILAIITQNGFMVAALLTAIIVAVYEEIIFRGVILGSVEKYIGFKAANVFQAILFALVHDDLSLFPFFFVFALVTGYWVKKSGGLLTGIFFHGINNFTVVVALYYISRVSVLL